MDDPRALKQHKARFRSIYKAEPGQQELGPLKWLPGRWQARGTGWNMIALPFASPRINFRVLMNQYEEELIFSEVDDNVPNRGIFAGSDFDTDQFLVALDYQQKIDQIAIEDFPESKKTGDLGMPIHHEPGLWLHMKNETTAGLDVARLATIPHGNSVLAVGRSLEIEGKPTIPDVSGLPIGVSQDLTNENNPYLAPYRHFETNKFFGTVDPKKVPGFPGFFTSNMNAILQFAQNSLPAVARTTVLHVETNVEDAGIVNIPFIERQADASEMISTFWIMELEEKDENGQPKLIMQYSQNVLLDFFERPDGSTNPDGTPKLIRWPHISIATLEKVSSDAKPIA